MYQMTPNDKTPGVILIVLDGCRPDGIIRAKTPQLDWIMANGAYTLRARTIFPSISFPCHISMLYGVKAHRHGTYGNYSNHVKMNGHHSILDLAYMCGRKVAAFYDWEQLRELSSPTVLDFAYYRRASLEKKISMGIAHACAEYFEAAKPSLCFINFGTIDTVGHEYGWMSEAYLNQIGVIDEAVGLIIDRIKVANFLEQYYIVILSDHGGTNKDHGGDTAEEMTIPWMVIGPGIRRGYEMTGKLDIYDTAPTIAHLLKLPFQGIWQGKIITEIFEF
jgi:predicted AlkP superfamily pyrophosphatase or phosphodiesterase